MVKHISSGSSFEDLIGYSRAVVDDHYVHVAGTTGMDYSVMVMPSSIEQQVQQCLKNIQQALEATNWRVQGNGGAAELLGIKPTTLRSRMQKLGIEKK